MLINKKNIKQYIRELNPDTQVATDVWPTVNEQVKTLIRIAIKRNGNHKRLTTGEFSILDPLKY